jgi:hypothetical protein
MLKEYEQCRVQSVLNCTPFRWGDGNCNSTPQVYPHSGSIAVRKQDQETRSPTR